jgi:hypothetical protein
MLWCSELWAMGQSHPLHLNMNAYVLSTVFEFSSVYRSLHALASADIFARSSRGANVRH